MIAVARLIFKMLSSSVAITSAEELLKEVEKALGMSRPKPATSIKPLPTSLIASSNSCSSRFMPPTKKQKPKQRSRFARIEPRIAALMTGIRSSVVLLFLDSRIMNNTISTMPPRNVSRRTPKERSATLDISPVRSSITENLG